jgi:hypothetical protein
VPRMTVGGLVLVGGLVPGLLEEEKAPRAAATPTAVSIKVRAPTMVPHFVQLMDRLLLPLVMATAYAHRSRFAPGEYEYVGPQARLETRSCPSPRTSLQRARN